jgi:hypothetical protein
LWQSTCLKPVNHTERQITYSFTACRRLIGPEPDAQEMVNTAKAFANHKVVLKRPYYTPVSEGTTAVYKSRSMRWEVFRSNRAPTQHQQQ